MLCHMARGVKVADQPTLKQGVALDYEDGSNVTTGSAGCGRGSRTARARPCHVRPGRALLAPERG